MTTVCRIAVIATHDTLWSLCTWTRALPRLIADGHEVAGFFTCDDRMAKDAGRDIFTSYIRTFGRCNYLVLGIFGLCVQVLQLAFGRPLSFHSLCRRHGINYAHVASVNDPALVQWVRDNRIDIVLVTIAQIIEKPLIDAARIAIVNRHPGVLPENRGLFPYVWACLENLPQGITYHIVNERIDAGAIVLRRIVDHPRLVRSMLAFDVHVATSYAEDMAAVLGCFASAQEQQDKTESRGMPSPENVNAIYKKGFSINRLMDIAGAVDLVR